MLQRLLFLSIFCLAFCASAFADAPLLSQVTLQLNAQTWVNTSNALAVVHVDLLLPKDNLVSARDAVLQKLNGAAQAKWHITQLQPGEDQSGMARLQIGAQARVSASEAEALRQSLAKLSKAGEKFQLVSLQFTPSFADRQQGEATLRSEIYRQAQQEIKQLDTLNPGLKYFIRSVRFDSSPLQPTPIMGMALARISNTGSPSLVAVGAQQKLSATVELAAIKNPS